MEIKSTDPASFRLVYDSCYSVLVKICYHIVYNMDIAEDLVQEAFERFYLKNISFPSADEAKYWLIRVAKNLALNHIRRSKRESNMVDKVKIGVSLSPSAGNGGEKELLDSETIREVRSAVAALPENLRMVIILKEYGNMDYKAISKVLGISEGNVKIRVHRARKKLEESLAGDEAYVY